MSRQVGANTGNNQGQGGKAVNTGRNLNTSFPGRAPPQNSNELRKIRESYKKTHQFIAHINKYYNNDILKIKAHKVQSTYGDWRYIDIVIYFEKILKNINKSRNNTARNIMLSNLNNRIKEIFKEILLSNGQSNKTQKIKRIINLIDKNKIKKLKKDEPFNKDNILKNNLINNSQLKNIDNGKRSLIGNNTLSSNTTIRKRAKKNSQINYKINKSHTINLTIEETELFFTLIYRDMIHDQTIKNYSQFKEYLLSNFISNSNNDIINLINKININNIKSKTSSNNKASINIQDLIRNKPPLIFKKTKGIPWCKSGINFKKYLIKYKFRSKQKYKGFDVVYDSDKNEIIHQLLYELFLSKKGETRTTMGNRSVARSLSSCATQLNSGKYKKIYNNRALLLARYSTDIPNKNILHFDNTNININIKYPFRTGLNYCQTNIKTKFENGKYLVFLNDKQIDIVSKKNSKKNGNPFGKFLGDFLMILKCFYNENNRPVFFATQDRNAAIIYNTFAGFIKEKKEKTKLIFVKSQRNKDYLYLFGMDDIISNPIGKKIIKQGPFPSNNNGFLSATNNNNSPKNNSINNKKRNNNNNSFSNSSANKNISNSSNSSTNKNISNSSNSSANNNNNNRSN